MKILNSVHPNDFKSYDTKTIRERFLMEDLVQPDQAKFVYTHYDRMINGAVQPITKTIILENYPQLRADFFLERREMGVINVGGPGVITSDKTKYDLNKLDALYLGKGAQEISFASNDSSNPAIFFILSAPAHQSYPTTLMNRQNADLVALGDPATANQRTIYKYIHKNGIQSCQLVMGLTILNSGSIWNTMPPHTHDRRMETYFYFDVAADQRVFHYMGQPDETRHILIANHQAVVSPPWSIHSGSGTSSYSFIWGMAGENMEFTDMDGAPIIELR